MDNGHRYIQPGESQWLAQRVRFRPSAPGNRSGSRSDPFGLLSRAESTSVIVTRSCAREGRWVGVNSEAPIGPEIETRPVHELPVPQAFVTTYEGGSGASGPSATETTRLFTTADIPEVVAAHMNKEETASLFTASQTTPPHSSQSCAWNITAMYIKSGVRLLCLAPNRWDIKRCFCLTSVCLKSVWRLPDVCLWRTLGLSRHK